MQAPLTDPSTPPGFPPGPPPARHIWDELLHLRDLQKDVLGTLAQRFATYGDFYHSEMRGVDAYSTCDPEIAHQVLVTDARSFRKRTADLEVLGNGLLTSDGEPWRTQRRRIQPGFRHESIARYARLMNEEVERLLDNAPPVIELHSSIMDLTLRIVCRALFGQHFSGKSTRLSRALRVLQDDVVRPKLFPPWLPTPGNLRKRRVQALIDAEVFSILDQSVEPGSLLSELRSATDEAGSMSRQQLRDEVVTLFLAGHETTALALTWGLYLVSLRPEIDSALYQEIVRVRPTGPIQIGDFEQLDLSGRVLKETLRLYPPAYVIPRVCAAPVDIRGYRIQPGSEVWLWIYFMHHDARWFRNPERFDPNRFLEGGEITQNPSSYLPFGEGTRTCVGRHFAMLESVIVLSSVLRRFRVRCLDARPLRPLPRITLAPARSVRVRLEPRT